MRAYWFSSNGKPQWGTNVYDVRPEPYIQEGEIRPCINGLHASVHPFDALQYMCGGFSLDLVELDGFIVAHPEGFVPDKHVASQRTHLNRIDANALLSEFARWCALQVVDLWQCPTIVRQYLETGDESIREEAFRVARNISTLDSHFGSSRAYYSAYYVISHDVAAYTAYKVATNSSDAAWLIRQSSIEAAQSYFNSVLDTGKREELRSPMEALQRTKLQELVDAAFAAAEANTP